MAVVNSKIEIDLTFRKYKPVDKEYVDMGKSSGQPLVLSEESSFKGLNLRTAIQKLIDLLPWNL